MHKITPATFYFVVSVLGFLVISCSETQQKPDKGSEELKQAVSDFYVSLVAIKSDEGLFAVEKMQEVADAYPTEPAAWSNLSIFAMRQGNFELATKHMQKALQHGEDNVDIQFLAGILESRKGNVAASLEYLREAAVTDSTNAKILYTLAEELARQNSKNNKQQIASLWNQILKQHPNNLAALMEVVHTAAKWGDLPKLNQALEDLEEQSGSWPDQIAAQFREQKAEILKKEGKNISFELAFLRNNLNELPQFQYDMRQIKIPSNQVGFLITEFMWLPNPDRMAAPIDEKLTFNISDVAPNRKVQLFKSISLADEQRGTTITISGETATIDEKHVLAFPGDGKEERLPLQVISTIDYNYDFLNDLAFAGSNGFKLYRQEEDSSFTDVSNSLNLPSAVLQKSYWGSWSYDLDLDGDLDLVLSAKDGSSPVLRNNGNGTFEVHSHFEDSEHIRGFLWADFDRDGDHDAVVLTEDGKVHLYLNERSDEFKRDGSLSLNASADAIEFGDLNADGAFEIISLHTDHISSTTYHDSTGRWETHTLVALSNTNDRIGSDKRIFIADLDNNAAQDLMFSDGNTSYYWLTGEDIELTSEPYTIDVPISGIDDMNGNNRLDLLGTSEQQEPVVLTNSGSKDYKARIISPRASSPLGDQRINSFGIGGEIESRTGLFYTKKPIDKPWVHFGLGTYEEAEMMRIVWPNGTIQTEFAELGYDSKIKNKQFLKGSCPWVMTHNGEQMEFVTDFIWRTSLGLRINDQGKADVIHSIDWVKIEGNQLKPKDGFYDVRITADLWESHFFDQVSLMAVDHSENTEVFVDERFALPAPEQKLYPMSEIYSIADATSHDGNDVTPTVASKDGKYVNSIPLTSYQGVAEEHYLEVSIGDEVPREKKLKLIASGWVYPTDTSINIAISQGDREPLQGIRVEVPNGEGGWKVVHQDLGFPSGKHKTMLVDLENVFEPGTERRVRLYTNMEIYWDQIRVGIQEDDIELQTKRLAAEISKLRYRGFSKLEKKARFTPTVPDYQQIADTSPKWMDLKGHYTRYGDVKELTKEGDDRYVIMNAGDELVFKFPELDPPPKGWTRDFVLIGDGWVKDGDFNTAHSETILPLPYHGMEDYSAEPGLLKDDPVFQKHTRDWVEYHTRYVSPQVFNIGLK